MLARHSLTQLVRFATSTATAFIARLASTTTHSTASLAPRVGQSSAGVAGAGLAGLAGGFAALRVLDRQSTRLLPPRAPLLLGGLLLQRRLFSALSYVLEQLRGAQLRHAEATPQPPHVRVLRVRRPASHVHARGRERRQCLREQLPRLCHETCR